MGVKQMSRYEYARANFWADVIDDEGIDYDSNVYEDSDTETDSYDESVFNMFGEIDY